MQRKTVCTLAIVAACLIACSSSALAQQFDPKTLPDFTKGGMYMEKYEMGLYPGGKNEMPKEHLEAGLRMAQLVRPRDKDGKIDEANGKIVAVNLGHSIATLIWRQFTARFQAKADEVNPKLVLVQGSMANNQLPEIRKLRGGLWDVNPRRLERAGVTPNQVQILFLHTTSNPPPPPRGVPPFPEAQQEEMRDVAKVLAHCVKLYPNLRICYITSDVLRSYRDMEPQVWREAFAFKWLIEAQIKGEKGYEFEDKGDVKRVLPWLCWGPYVWDANWTREMFDPRDGVHPTPAACDVVVDKYWDLLKKDPVAKAWFWKPGASPAPNVKPSPATQPAKPTTAPAR